MSCKNPFKLQNSNTASYLKIQVDSIFIEQPVLSEKNSMKSPEKQGFMYTYFFLTKIVTAQT